MMPSRGMGAVVPSKRPKQKLRTLPRPIKDETARVMKKGGKDTP